MFVFINSVIVHDSIILNFIVNEVILTLKSDKYLSIFLCQMGAFVYLFL